jgi:hypothetical protein
LNGVLLIDSIGAIEEPYGASVASRVRETYDKLLATLDKDKEMQKDLKSPVNVI